MSGFVVVRAFVADLLAINNTTTQAVIVRNHSADNDSGGGVFCWMTGTATSNNGTIVVPTTPNGGFWKRSFDGPVNVRWFGARGDGATNDTTAIQAAINAVGLVGGAVLIPPGTFCADNLTIGASRVTMTGVGKTSILAKNAGFNALITVGPSAGVENVVIRDLMITTKAGVTPAGWGIFCNSSSSWLTLDSIFMFGMAFGIGLEPVSPSQVHNALIRNCALNVITNQGVALFNCVDTFISDSGIFMNGYTAGSAGLQYDSGCDGLYTSNLIVTQGQTPIAIQNSNPGIANNQPPRHGFFSRTAADGGSTSASLGAWQIKDGHRMQLDLCWGASQQAGAAGFDIRGPARNIELVNCIAIGNSQEGVRISDGASSIGVVGGEVVANSREAASFNGINVINGRGIRIVGVRVTNDTADFGLGRQQFAISLGASAKDFLIQGCDLRGNVRDGSSIFDASGSTNKIIDNNLPVAASVAIAGTGC